MPDYQVEVVIDQVGKTLESWLIRATRTDRIARGTIFKRLDNKGSGEYNVFFLNRYGILIRGRAKDISYIMAVIEELYACRSIEEVDQVENDWTVLARIVLRC